MTALSVTLSRVAGRPTLWIAGTVLGAIVLVSLCAPLIVSADPLRLNPMQRMLPPSFEHPFGTDMLGRDVFARTLYGGRLSLMIGISVATMVTVIGLFFGLLAGFVRWTDIIIMRIVDGLQAIPAILLAIAIAAIAGGGVFSVIFAITVAEVPLVVRLVRSVVLTLRGQLFIEAARAVGTPTHRIMTRHIIPNTVGALVVQATYICGISILFEAYLSFLGAGIPPEIPSWGNIMAEGRNIVMLAPWTILCPGIFVALVVLSFNELGDGLQDFLDPRTARHL
ncbi:ABC transporter permease [Acuticoccus sp. M5D2P5]|uniref:ABC transporter permease n=1 Tax=Acuticoccus kalidii TaxID=2910977 RepID=UPI001F1BD51A|nr:ABC transporter permease [Acuticoccus kalidii]MCF3933387.1 ABC transporter permease [Acuticoccus kalidii]